MIGIFLLDELRQNTEGLEPGRRDLRRAQERQDLVVSQRRPVHDPKGFGFDDTLETSLGLNPNLFWVGNDARD